MRKRVTLAAIACLTILAGTARAEVPAPLPSTDDSAARFAQVDLKLLTAGEKQPVREIGSFSASLPLGKPGRLARAVEIISDSRGIKTTAELQLVLTPSLDETGLLHCFAVSEAALPGAAPDSRAKDLTFPHPGSQLMEIFADPVTRVRVILSVSARLQEEPRGPAVWPVLHFGLRVEQWAGARRDEVEALQLQSLEGRSVSHDYARRVPRIVEGREGDIVLDDLPVVRPGEEGQSIAAGQSFVIPLEGPADGGKKEKSGEHKKSPLKKSRRDRRFPQPLNAKEAPPAVPKAPAAPPAPQSLVWDEEYYRITLTPLQISAGGMRLRVTMEGRTFDPDTGLLMDKMELQQEKEVLSGEPVPFYLTTERKGGPIGFVAWVLPAWGPGVENPSPSPAAPQR